MFIAGGYFVFDYILLPYFIHMLSVALVSMHVL